MQEAIATQVVRTKISLAPFVSFLTRLFEIEANAFLPHMVRRIVGALVEVGRSRLTPGEFERMVNEAYPGAASMTAPPRGLCLMKVRYESGLFDGDIDEDI